LLKKEIQEAITTINLSEYEQARRQAIKGYELLSTPFISNHFEGLTLIAQAKDVCPEAVKLLERELEEQAGNGVD